MEISTMDNLEAVLVSQMETVSGLAGRVVPLLDVPYSTGPLAVYVQTRGANAHGLEGRTGLLSAEFTVYAMHNTYKKMRALAAQLAEACQSLHGTRQNGVWIEQVIVEQIAPDLDEYNVNLFRRTYKVSLDYQIYGGM